MGGSPQSVTGLGYKFSGRKFWFAGIYANYFDEIYLEPNPDRRTAEATQKYQNNEMVFADQIRKQERLPGYFVLNANGGKSFRIAKKYMLNLNLSINNILNNTGKFTSGYESLRWDQADVNKFPSKYYYIHGTTYMLIINCNF